MDCYVLNDVVLFGELLTKTSFNKESEEVEREIEEGKD